MVSLFLVIIGGGLGAGLRYGVNALAYHASGESFWGTLGVNVIGSFAMGLLVALFSQVWQPPQEIRALLTTGVLGGFTTFSSFSLDTALLWERGDIALAALYVAASVAFSVGALFAAMALVRSLSA